MSYLRGPLTREEVLAAIRAENLIRAMVIARLDNIPTGFARARKNLRFAMVA